MISYTEDILKITSSGWNRLSKFQRGVWVFPLYFCVFHGHHCSHQHWVEVEIDVIQSTQTQINMATSVKVLKRFIQRVKKHLFVKERMHASRCVVQGYNNWSRRRRNFLAQKADRLGWASEVWEHACASRIVICLEVLTRIPPFA